MKRSTISIIVLVFLAVVLMMGAFSGGVLVGRNYQFENAITTPIVEDQYIPPSEKDLSDLSDYANTPAELEELFKPFWQAWKIVIDDYVDQPLDEQKLMRGAINGMLESIGDPYTSYLDPDLFKQSNVHLQGIEYEGIGAWVDLTQDYLTIISPMPGSPAEKAGLKPGDQVVAVDGEDVTGLDGELVRDRVVGPAGTTVILTIKRETVETTFDVEVVRKKIISPTVQERTYHDGKIAYVRLYTFGDTSLDDLKDALKRLLRNKPQGLILDLRYNGGGYRDTAIDVASEFIEHKIIMYQEYGDGRIQEFSSNSEGLATAIPLVVLINEGSASASEIVAGAIQDYGRGIIVGVTSFGKGSVQTYHELTNGEGGIRVTIANWLTPNKRSIQDEGITPDFEVIITEEDYQADQDPQLEKAIELLLDLEN